MPVNPGDIKDVIVFPTVGKTAMGQAIPVYSIRFSLRGQGPFSVEVPVDGYTPAIGIAAVRKRAEEICATLDGLS